MIFFDGEEAFNRWSATDSLYGSRHLAQLWSTQNSLLGGLTKEVKSIKDKAGRGEGENLTEANAKHIV